MKEKIQKVIYQGKLNIGGKLLDCAVLENEKRVISLGAVYKAFGRTKRGRAKHETRVPNMPSFIDANNLQPFISKELRGVLKQIEYSNLLLMGHSERNNEFDKRIRAVLCRSMPFYASQSREKGFAKRMYNLIRDTLR